MVTGPQACIGSPQGPHNSWVIFKHKSISFQSLSSLNHQAASQKITAPRADFVPGGSGPAHIAWREVGLTGRVTDAIKITPSPVQLWLLSMMAKVLESHWERCERFISLWRQRLPSSQKSEVQTDLKGWGNWGVDQGLMDWYPEIQRKPVTGLIPDPSHWPHCLSAVAVLLRNLYHGDFWLIHLQEQIYRVGIICVYEFVLFLCTCSSSRESTSLSEGLERAHLNRWPSCSPERLAEARSLE